MQKLLLLLTFLFAIKLVVAQSPTKSQEDSLSDVFLKQMLLGNNFEVAKEYKFDIEMQYEQTYQNSSKKNENVYVFLAKSNPSITSIFTNKEDSTKVVLDFQNRFIVLLNSSPGGKTAITLPVETLDSEMIKNSNFNQALSLSKKTGKTLKINNFDCQEYFFEDDSDKVTYYLTPIIKDVPFSSAPLISMTKHSFNTEGHIIRLISEKKSNKELSILEYKSTNPSDYSINTEEYTMLGGKNGLFNGLLEDSTSLANLLGMDALEGGWQEKDGKFGFTKKVGDSLKVIIPYEYDETISIVMPSISLIKKGEQYAIFSSQKEAFISPFKYIGSAMISNETFAVMFENGLYGFADTTGKELTEGIFDGIGQYVESANLVNVQKDNLWGFTNKYGKQIIPFKYEDIYMFDEGNTVTQASKKGKWGLIDVSGKELSEFIYDEIKYFGPETKFRAANKIGKWGVIDDAGKIIIPFEYQDINGISEVIPVKKNNKWGLIDMKNKGVVPYLYDDMRFMSEGLIPVKKGNKWGYVDTDGKIIIPFIYDEANPFAGGIASVILKEKYLVIDKTGKCTENCD